MKLFLIEQTQNDDYDTYDSAVVAAHDEETARQMHPGTGNQIDWGKTYSSWCSKPEQVKVRCIGDAADDVPHGVVCASFNAG